MIQFWIGEDVIAELPAGDPVKLHWPEGREAITIDAITATLVDGHRHVLRVKNLPITLFGGDTLYIHGLVVQ